MYERDESGLRDARENLKDAQDDEAKAKIQEEIDLIQKEIDLLEKQKESIQEQMEETSKYYEKIIKEQEKMFDSMVKELEKTKSKWEELAEVDEISKAWGLVSEEMESLGYSIDDVLNGNDAAFNAFKDRYIAVLSEMHSGDEHYLQGLQETAGKIPETLGEVGSAASEAKEPVKGLSDAANTASTNVGTLGTKASTAATGVGQLKSSSEGVADNLKGLNDVEMGGLINGPLTELENKLIAIRNLINGEDGTSLKAALESLGTDLNLQTVVDAFTQLANAVKTAVAEIGGGGADAEETYGGAGRSGKNGMPSNVPASGVEGGTGEGLVGAINAVGEAAQASIGNGSEEEGATATGTFNALNTVIQGVVDLIGQGGEQATDEAEAGTLTGAINSLLETTKASLIAGGEDGVIGMFSELAEQIGACAEAAASLLSAIQAMQGMGFPAMPALGNGQFTGTAIPHAEGTAKYDGDWGIKHNEKALTGELGPEILLRNGKYHILGKDGPEFVDLKKDDVILNHKQTEQVLSKKNRVIGPSHADGTLPHGFFRVAEDSSISALKAKIKEAGLPTLDGIKSALQAQTDAIKSEVRNIINSNSSATTVNQSNTFNISGVSGEDVARQINTTLVNTFSGMSLNAYQRSMA